MELTSEVLSNAVHCRKK